MAAWLIVCRSVEHARCQDSSCLMGAKCNTRNVQHVHPPRNLSAAGAAAGGGQGAQAGAAAAGAGQQPQHGLLPDAAGEAHPLQEPDALADCVWSISKSMVVKSKPPPPQQQQQQQENV
jgi:hypothetical protein